MGSVAKPEVPVMNPSLHEVFATIEDNFRRTELGNDRWYVAACAALACSNDPERCNQLYLYLVAQPHFSTPEQRQYLIRRLREVLVKTVSIVGICKPMEAIMAINQCEQDEDKDISTTREGWQCDGANLERGMNWLCKIYSHNTEDMINLFNDHPDFLWISKNLTYGLYLSDRQILDDIETKLVVLPGIMIQNLYKETYWHIRGTRRVGVSKHDVQIVWDSVQLIAKHVGIHLHRVPNVERVEQDN